MRSTWWLVADECRLDAQMITEDECKQYHTLRNRLLNSEKLWSEHDCMLYPDYEELCHTVLHRDAKVVVDDQCMMMTSFMQIVQNVNNTSLWYFVEPIPTGGTLHQYIQRHKTLDEVDGQRIFRLLLLIIGFCHKIGIVIRDLKLAKLVFDNEEWSGLVQYISLFSQRLPAHHCTA